MWRRTFDRNSSFIASKYSKLTEKVNILGEHVDYVLFKKVILSKMFLELANSISNIIDNC